MDRARGSLFIAALMGAICFRFLTSGGADQAHDSWRTLVAGLLGAVAAWCCGWAGDRLAERRRLRRPGRR